MLVMHFKLEKILQGSYLTQENVDFEGTQENINYEGTVAVV